MSKRIKGITIEIDGSTKGLDKALGSVNKQSNSLQRELKEVDKLLKFNPGNTELIAQKQEILQKAVEASADKLKQLKDAQEQVNEQFKKGDISDDQYRAFQREIVDTESKLKSLEDQLRDTGEAASDAGDDVAGATDKYAEAGDKLQKVGSNMTSAGGALTAGVTLPLVAAGAGAVQMAADFEAAQGKVQAQLGVTGEEAEKLSKIAKNVWKGGWGESIDEVTDNLALVRQNMGELNDTDLETVVQNAYTLRDAFGAEVNETTRTASVLMKNFGVDSETAFDLMTTGFQRGGNFSDELLDTLREYAPQFKGLGYDAEEFTAILIAGAESGAFNLDKIGDAAKESFLRVGDGSKSSRDALEALGLDFEKIENDIAAGGDSANSAFAAVSSAIASVKSPAEKSAAAIALFGTPIEDLGPEFQDFFATVNKDLGDFEGSTKKATDAMNDNFGVKLQTVLRELAVALMPLGNTLIELAEKILPIVSTAATAVAAAFESMPGAVQTVIVIFGILAAAIGPILVVLGTIVGAVGNLIPIFVKVGEIVPIVTKAFGFMKTAFNVVRVAMLALSGPIGIIIGVLAALVAAGVLVYKNWDTIKEYADKVFGALGEFFSNVWSSVSEVFTNFGTKIAEFVKNNWQTILAFMTGPIGLAVLAIAKNWEAIRAKTVEVFDKVKEKIGAVIQFIKNLFTNLSLKFKELKTDMFERARERISAVIEKVKSFFTNLKLKFPAIATDVFDRAREKVESVINKIKSFFSGLKLKLPSISMPKLPHFSLSGKFSLAPPSVPKLSVDWYKKGSVFTGPSIIGVGEEPGVSEAVIPLKPSVLSQIGAGIAEATGGFGGGGGIVIENMIVRNDNDIRKIAQELHKLQARDARGLGR